jgi:hypothetical protein
MNYARRRSFEKPLFHKCALRRDFMAQANAFHVNRSAQQLRHATAFKLNCALPLGIRKCAKEYVRANNSSGKFPYGVPMEKLSAARPANLAKSESQLRNSAIISGAGEGI